MENIIRIFPVSSIKRSKDGRITKTVVAEYATGCEAVNEADKLSGRHIVGSRPLATITRKH